MKTGFLLVWGLASVALLAQIQVDVPARGEYLFPLQLTWEADRAGDMPLAVPGNIQVADDGTVFCYDRRNLKYLIYDAEGNLLHAFGKRGEGPGEIRRIEQAPLFLVDDVLIVLDTGRLHFFDLKGRFVGSKVIRDHWIPVLFFNKDEFLIAPRTILDIPDGKAAIQRVNLTTGKKEPITTFEVFKGGTISGDNVQAAMVDPRLTPLMTIGHHGNRLYFAMSDRYEIHICDLKGDEMGVFGLERKKTRVSDEAKTADILRRAQGRAPEELLRTLIKKLPNEETYFFNIDVYGGLVYVYLTHFERRNIQRIDLFDADGRYLYRGVLRFGEQDTIVSGPVFKGDWAYVAVENRDGEVLLRKYRTTLPR